MAASSKRVQAGHAHRFAAAVRVYQKMSVTLLAGLVAKISAALGSGKLSRHVAETLEEKRRQAALSEFLAHHERKYGPISDEAVQEELGRWDVGARGPGGDRVVG